MTLILENTGDTEWSYGLGFSCEKYVDGQWEEVAFPDGIAFADVLYTVQPHSIETISLGVELLDQPLDEGLYRLTGSKLWIEGHDAAEVWQLNFRVTADARPEPDYAVYISAQPVPTMEGCLVTDRLPAYLVNNTGEDGQVLLIPHLERWDEAGEWAEVPYRESVGFCGTPDPLPAGGKVWSEDAAYLWGTLEDGRYRLSYKAGRMFETEDWARGEFTLYTPEENRGLPLFSAEVFRTGGDSPGRKLSREDASALLRIFQAGEWTEGTADCASDYRLVLSGQTVYFHSECGTFNDVENGRSFSVTGEDCAAILAVLREYS